MMFSSTSFQGVGYPLDIVVCSALGADMYDCVYPTRTARFGTALIPEVMTSKMWCIPLHLYIFIDLCMYVLKQFNSCNYSKNVTDQENLCI